MNYKLLFVLVSVMYSVYLPTSAFSAETVNTVHLQVEGMVSDVCPVILRSAVSKIEGVKQVQASLEDHSATIEYDTEKTSLDVIQKTIKEKAGFDTRPKH